MSTSVCPCSVVRPCPYLVVLGRVHPLRVFRRHLERLVVRVALDRVDIPGFTDDGGSGEAWLQPSLRERERRNGSITSRDILQAVHNGGTAKQGCCCGGCLQPSRSKARKPTFLCVRNPDLLLCSPRGRVLHGFTRFCAHAQMAQDRFTHGSWWCHQACRCDDVAQCRSNPSRAERYLKVKGQHGGLRDRMAAGRRGGSPTTASSTINNNRHSQPN